MDWRPMADDTNRDATVVSRQLSGDTEGRLETSGPDISTQQQ